MNGLTLKDLLPKFIDSLKQKGRSPATILAYRTDLEQLTSFLVQNSKVSPTQVIGSDLETFRDTLLSQKYTPKSTSRKLNAVKTFFRYLKQQNVITIDPSELVSHPKIENSLPKFLTQIEYRALRDVSKSDSRIFAIIELVLQTGIRISEVASLKTKNINGDSLTIEAYATQPQRSIPINQAVKNAVDLYTKNDRPKTDSPYIFVSKNSKPLAVRNIRAAVDRYMKKAEIPSYSVNDLRTTFIIENLKAGIDLVLLSQVAGHKRLSTTQRYLELAGAKERGKKQTLQEL